MLKVFCTRTVAVFATFQVAQNAVPARAESTPPTIGDAAFSWQADEKETAFFKLVAPSARFLVGFSSAKWQDADGLSVQREYSKRLCGAYALGARRQTGTRVELAAFDGCFATEQRKTDIQDRPRTTNSVV